MIPYGRQSISQADVDAVIETLRSDFLTQGPAVPRFEAAATAAWGAQHGVAVNSATAALHLACLALDVGPGDLVWTSPVTFVASVNCALYCGAKVDFVDIDPRTYCMSVDRLAEKLGQADKAGRLPKVVIPVHLAGQSCEMEAIAALATRYGFRVIEDASHAVGADYQGRPVGDCRFSDIAVFSFHPVKIITTGEGGLALTDDPALAERMALYRSHGVTRDAAAFEHQPDGGWYYEQQALGFNYRMTDIAAALGASQLTRLEDFIARRRALATRYDELLGNAPLVRPWQHPDSLSSWHLYIVRVAAEAHKAAFDGLRERGIGVNLHYMPVYLQPFHRRLGFEPGLCAEAEAYYAEAITLPLYPALSDEEQDGIVGAVKAVLGCA